MTVIILIDGFSLPAISAKEDISLCYDHRYLYEEKVALKSILIKAERTGICSHEEQRTLGFGEMTLIYSALL